MDNKKDKYEPIIRYTILSLMGVVAIVYLYIKLVSEPYKLRADSRYTIGKITKIEFPSEGDQMADIQYVVNGKIYFNSIPLDGTKIIQPKVEQRYLIKYHPSNPNIINVLLDYLIADSIVNVPNDGWKEIPFNKSTLSH